VTRARVARFAMVDHARNSASCRVSIRLALFDLARW
jgi:hypothetical protein